MKYLIIISMSLLILSCDSNSVDPDSSDKDQKQQLQDIEYITENFYGDWANEKLEIDMNGDYILNENSDTFNLKSNGSAMWYGIYYSGLGRKMSYITEPTGSWSFNELDSTIKINYTGRLVDTNGRRGSELRGNLNGKVIVLNEKRLEILRIDSSDNGWVNKYHYQFKR